MMIRIVVVGKTWWGFGGCGVVESEFMSLWMK